MSDYAMALDQVEAAGVPQLADTLEMIRGQQVVVSEPQDRLAAGELKRAISVLVPITRRLWQLERLKARGTERAQRFGRAVAATIAEDEHLLGRPRLP